MGVKYLWSVFTPFCERKPLYELQDKKVAIDLSCWVCEAQNVAEYNVHPRMYLRNLYFRACYLLLMDVTPVFVLEGKAPELKYDTIAARNAIQFKGAKPKTDNVKTGKDRTRFNFTLKQCQQMLKLMGLACVQGSGEAESMCAYLNEDNLVDGIISQDSDCFAYGAQIVYRNFSISTQGAHAAKGGSVDVYDVSKVIKHLNFGRNKIVALALLCGSDYCEGVDGIGKESALKLFQTVSDDEILDKLRSWRKDKSRYESLERKISDKNICTSCGHSGKVQSHTKSGCWTCKTSKGCDFSKFKEERLNIKNEINIRSKALLDPEFPNENLIKEFLVKKDNVSVLNLKWKQPDLCNFVKFTLQHMLWSEIYAFEKFLPIFTRWQLLNFEYIEKSASLKGILEPERIKKKRAPKGVACYEIIWSDKSEYYKNLIPKDQMEEHGDEEKLWSTIEPQHLVEKAYPILVEQFLESKKPKTKRKRATKKVAIDEIDDLMKNTSISEPVIKKPRKPRANKKIAPVKMLDSFMTLNQQQKSSTPIQSTKDTNQIYNASLNMSVFDNDDDILDLSDVIDNMVNADLPSYVHENLQRFGLEVKPSSENENVLNQSSFFISKPTDDDLFEQTINEFYQSEENVEENEDNSEENKSDSDCDSFLEKYVPLSERLRDK